MSNSTKCLQTEFSQQSNRVWWMLQSLFITLSFELKARTVQETLHAIQQSSTMMSQKLFIEWSSDVQELQYMDLPISFPPLFLLNLLNRIFRKKSPSCLTPFSSFFSVTLSLAPVQGAKNCSNGKIQKEMLFAIVVALTSIRSDFPH